MSNCPKSATISWDYMNITLLYRGQLTKRERYGEKNTKLAGLLAGVKYRPVAFTYCGIPATGNCNDSGMFGLSIMFCVDYFGSYSYKKTTWEKYLASLHCAGIKYSIYIGSGLLLYLHSPITQNYTARWDTSLVLGRKRVSRIAYRVLRISYRGVLRWLKKGCLSQLKINH